MTELGDNLTLRAISWDLAVLLFVAVALMILGLTGGKRAVIPFLLSLYIARTIAELTKNFPQAEFPAFAEPLIFLLVLGGVTWLLAGSALTDFLRFSAKGLSVWWQVLIAGILGAGLFGVLFFPLLPEGSATFSALIVRFILQPPMPFLWALAPVGFLFFLKAEARD